MDDDDAISAWARKYRSSVVILRPDRFVFATDSEGLSVPTHTTSAVAGAGQRTGKRQVAMA